MFRSEQIALQLYTLRDSLKQDFLGTLKRVADAGYPAVEFAGYGDMTVAQLRLALDDLGLRALGAHVQYPRLLDEFPAAAAEVQTLGGDYIIAPAVPRDHLASADAVRRLADSFNRIGERARASGLTFAFHNHHWEFAPLDGATTDETAFEILLTETDPDFVGFELDVFWAETAGRSGHRLIRSYPGRFPLLHVKDMEDSAERADAPVGTGTISWGPVLEAGEFVGGTKWLIVEQDHPKDPLNDVAVSYTNLRKLLSAQQ